MMVPTFSKSIQHSHNFHLLAIAFFTSIILFTSLHKGGLSGFDDAIYAHEAKQMLVTGDWWNVRFNGGLNFEYPPLFIWLDALSMRVLGITDFAAKFPSAVLSLWTVLLVFLIVRRLSDDFWLPICAAWVLMLSPFFMKYSMHAMTDVPFTFFVTLSIYLYLRGIERHWYWIPSGLSIGMGILTRSILGLIPAAIIVTHLIYTRRGWVLRKSQFWAGALLAVLLPALWFGVQYSLYGPQFVAGHFSFVTSKLTSTGGFGAGHFLGGLLVYPWLLLQLYWPWLPFMVAGLVSQTRVMFRGREDLAALSILWVVMVMGPFSLVDAKMFRYILPAFPAFAILSAVSLNSAIGRLKRARPVAIFVALCTIALLAAIFANPRYRAEEMQQLAPVVDANTNARERVLVYFFGKTNSVYHSQFLWYTNRFSEYLIQPAELQEKLQLGMSRTFVVDQSTYAALVRPAGVTVQVLGETPNFICFKLK